MSEQVYYRSRRVRITSARAIFGAKTYAMNMITSVEALEIAPNRIWPVLLGMFGSFLFLCSGARLIGEVSLGTIAAAMISFLVLGASIVWWLRQKTKYAVVLCSAAKEKQVCLHEDEQRIKGIVAAINQAIIDRG